MGIKPIAGRRKGKAPASKGVRDASVGNYVNSSAIAVKSEGALTSQVTGVPSGDRAVIIKKIKKGLSFSVVGKLEKALDVNRKDVGDTLSIPASTMTRRKKEGVLHTDESDRVVRIAQLYDAAVAMFLGDRDAAKGWLQTPLDLLDNETPLEHARTELGSRDVEDLIGRIRHGVFS